MIILSSIILSSCYDAYAAGPGVPDPRASYGAVNVSNASATLVPTNGLVSRFGLMLFNNGPNTIWCGYNTSVTSDTGMKVGAGVALSIDVGLTAGTKVYCIADTAAQVSPANTRYMEIR